jgi:hypothetical protein
MTCLRMKDQIDFFKKIIYKRTSVRVKLEPIYF